MQQSPASERALDSVTVLRAVMEGTSATSGDVFFAKLVENLSRALDTQFASIGLLDDETGEHIDTIAMWSSPELQENIRYELAGTPCENVMSQETCLYPDHVQEAFPRDDLLREMSIECYVGTPLFDGEGHALGVLNVFDTRPLSEEKARIATMVLEIFASRAVTELDRQATHDSLLRHKAQLEELVEERTVALQRSREQLARSERLASLGTLASGIAHEINNPLGIVQFATEMLRARADERETVLEESARILENVGRCKQIIRNVLRFAREEASEKAPLDVNGSVREALDLLRTDATTRSVDISESLAETIPLVSGNATELVQVFVNLLRNALASRDVSKVTIETECEDGVVSVRVADDGEGIPVANRPYVFDPFYSTRHHDGGTGLGLSICHGIVQEHRGEIEIEDRPTGCSIRVDLPIDSASSAS